MSKNKHEVIIVGGGISGMSAGIFTSRSGLDTIIFDTGDSFLLRNSHLENFPGFPLGVNPRLLLDMMKDQAENAGCTFKTEKVVDLDLHPDSGFVIKTSKDEKWQYKTDYVIAATPGDIEYLSEIDIETVEKGKNIFIETDGKGRTNVENLYATGRLAQKPLQAIISAGHGAEVAMTLISDSEVSLSHDWIVPEGFFTNKGREVPPGCEEISEKERLEREKRSLEVMREYFDEPYDSPENVLI